MAMRRSVFLAVWLGLVLSLLKESAAETNDNTTVTPTSISTANNTLNGTTEPTVTPSPTPSANNTLNGTTEPTVTPSPTPSANNTLNGTTEPTVTPSPTPSANNTLNGTTEPTVTPSPTPSANNTLNGTTEPTVTPSPTPSANNTLNGTTEPTVTPSPTPSANNTLNGTTESTVTPSPTPSDFCRGDPCGKNLATCISLNSNYTCECKYGFYYSNENCYRGKVFPATIAVNANYTDRLQDVNSAEYEDMFNNLSKFFKEALGNLGYVRTVIVKIQPPSKSRNSAPLNVTVTNLFMLNSTADAATVDFAVKYAIENGSQFNVDSYLVAKQCDIYQCDTKTTVCEEGTEFPECKCKPDLEKTQWDDLSCSACSNTCSAKANKYCVKEQDVPICKCMANFKNESGNCVACPVGYSGEECTDNIELILIIVGTVLGAIVLSLVIAVSIISVRAKDKQNPEKRSLIKSGYSGTNTSDDRPSMFPRVQTTSGHANPGYQPNNPYEMHSNNRDNFPERDYDDLYEISREPRGFRKQSRY